MRPINDLRGSPVVLVDKILGNAYEVVKMVASKLSILQYLAEMLPRMETLVLDSDNIISLKLVEIRFTPINTALNVLVPLPTEISQDDLVDYDVLFLGSDGVLYSYESGKFTYVIASGQLVVTFNSSMSSKLMGGEVRWNLSYRVEA